MNIRKHWKNFVLAATAVFWVSCGEDNSAAAENIAQSSSSEMPESSAESSSAIPPESSSSATVAQEISSSEELAESSSSEVTAKSSSAGMTAESSSAGTVGDCNDTKQFPLIVNGSDIRCTGNKMSTEYKCCDGSIIKAPKVFPDINCSAYQEISDSIPEDVPAYWVNDTLYTRQGREDRNNRVRAENKRLYDELDVAQIDSLSQNKIYCGEHGGIKSREIYFPMNTNESVCEILHREASQKLYYENLENMSLSKAVRECISSKMRNYFECIDCLYGNYSAGDILCADWATAHNYDSLVVKPGVSSWARSNATFECADGTIEVNPEYTANKQATEELEARCNVPLDDVVNRIESCK